MSIPAYSASDEKPTDRTNPRELISWTLFCCRCVERFPLLQEGGLSGSAHVQMSIPSLDSVTLSGNRFSVGNWKPQRRCGFTCGCLVPVPRLPALCREPCRGRGTFSWDLSCFLFSLRDFVCNPRMKFLLLCVFLVLFACEPDRCRDPQQRSQRHESSLSSWSSSASRSWWLSLSPPSVISSVPVMVITTHHNHGSCVSELFPRVTYCQVLFVCMYYFIMLIYTSS